MHVLINRIINSSLCSVGWWHVDDDHKPMWELAEDPIGSQMMALVRDANNLRAKYPALRLGWPNILHEDRPNGVIAWERVGENMERIVFVLNAGKHFPKADNMRYGSSAPRLCTLLCYAHVAQCFFYLSCGPTFFVSVRACAR